MASFTEVVIHDAVMEFMSEHVVDRWGILASFQSVHTKWYID